MKMLSYQFYATLLDAYQGFVGSSEIYQQFWGFSENPELTEEEFEEKQKQSLLDRINRVPFDSEAADQGTAFNEVIDCWLMGKKSSKMDIRSDKENGIITAMYNNRTFIFPISLCWEFVNYYQGAVPQMYTEGILSTHYGDVKLYGYLDELMPFRIHDIKMTSKYSAGKFKKHWQHIVYPFCLHQQGIKLNDFEYNIAVMTKSSYSTYTEFYSYVPERDIPLLKNHVEGLIEFLNDHKDLITDKKIFNQ